MGRKRNLVPTLRRHKASGQAFIKVDGKAIYLGVWGRPETRQRYRAEIHRLATEATAGTTLGTLTSQYLAWAESYYVKNGRTTSQVEIIRAVIRCLVLFRAVPLEHFGPDHLRAIQDRLIQSGATRDWVNRVTRLTRRMVRWGVSRGLCPPTTLALLATVDPIRKGRTPAPDSEPVRPADEASLRSLKPHVTPMVWDVIQLQLLTGMRPGEVVSIRVEDVDTFAWTYEDVDHKMSHHGQSRVIHFGPKAREIVSRRIALAGTGPLFVCRGKSTGKPYTVSAYRNALKAACQAAGVATIRPNQIRHTAATRFRKEFGLDVARAILGHSDVSTTTLYAERDLIAVRAAMEALG